MSKERDFLRQNLSEENCQKLFAIDIPFLEQFVAKYVELGQPESVFVATDSDEDVEYVRRLAVETGEEQELNTPGHTVHFDGYYDQARDKENTKYLLAPETDLGERLNSVDKETGLKEVHEFLEGSMKSKELLVRFFCLGPQSSPFSIRAVQLTDSPYVAHSEDILYRRGYDEFLQMDSTDSFFRFVHSEGKLEEGVSTEVDKRRVYIDLDEDIVYSTNTQYGGNTIGLKKLALRLAINKASREGWLAEHMLVAGIHGPNDRVTYFTGAYPSACGKTSTAMLPGESVVGDDIAYLRPIDGKLRAANVESGIFGIIRDVNTDDDPIIWDALHRPAEIIFSNVLVGDDNNPYWLGMGEEIPDHGRNHSGEWHAGKTDNEGREITPSHKNARYTLHLESLSNCDPHLHDPEGVEVSGVIYGGRDSDTSVPVEQAFDWTHGIITKGASLESETTAATLGEEGVRVFQPMSNIDFVSIPLGQYIQNNIDAVKGLDSEPIIFGVNYFLKDESGDYLNGMHDKRVWLKWMELRVHDEVEALERPTGLIPRYEDLASLFDTILGQSYSRVEYEEQFRLRIPENLAKIDRIEQVYRESVPDTPDILFEALEAQRKRLESAR
ncbi:MAG: phosphoenolpyruvate carboxykinase (GTP) [Planctomycetes bacterium]|nr:phosphoenolpyruvate carboxykinase (GTP) [Planctomycetota bacterium]